MTRRACHLAVYVRRVVRLCAVLCAPGAFAAAAPEVADPPQNIEDILAAAHADTEARAPTLAAGEDRAGAWGELGMLYHAQQRLAQASGAYRRAIAEADSARWRYLLAVALGDLGEVEEAIAQYRAVLAVQPDHALAAYRLGAALLLEGDAQAAARALDRARRGMPESAAVLAALGDAAMAVEDWRGARALLERAAALAPEAGRIAYKLSLVFRQLGDAKRASEWLERRNAVPPPIDDPLLLEVAALSRTPRFFVRAGDRAWQRGDEGDALAAWRQAAALAPEDADIGLVYARALELTGESDRALWEVRRVLAQNADSAPAWYLLASLLRGADPEESKRAVRRSLELAEDAAARALLAALAMHDKRFAEAARQYQTLAAADPQVAYYQYWLGMARLGAGDCPGGRSALASALLLEPGQGQALLALTRADALCGDGQARAEARERALALVRARDDADTRITLAFAELALGGAAAAESIVADYAEHPDAALLLAALERRQLPARPFADASPWWTPGELR